MQPTESLRHGTPIRRVRTVRAGFLLALCLSWPVATWGAEPGLAEPNWDRALAAQAAAVDIGGELADLLALARIGDDAAVLAALRSAAQRPDWPMPARERLLRDFALGLADLRPHAVGPAVVAYLRGWKAQTLVPLDDHPEAGVPLFNVAAAAQGTVNAWQRQLGAGAAAGFGAAESAAWMNAYLAAEPATRSGYIDALETASTASLGALAAEVAVKLAARPELTPLLARLGARLGEPDLLTTVIRAGRGPGVAAALRTALDLAATERMALLREALEQAPPEHAALAIAILGPGLARQDEAGDWLRDALERPELAGTSALALLAAGDADGANRIEAVPQTTDSRVVEWVEDAPLSDTSRIALGYPVPRPLDTAMPFDGFRSYAGLDARHRELAEGTPWVHPVEIGLSRKGRSVLAYRLGDADLETARGLPEHAMLTNGGIHAREWQSHEVATGIMEHLATADGDPLVSYLRDNANIIVIPVLNVDGFLQTQRYPSLNWLGTDPDDPEESPRDGRMRRKNMLGADEDLYTGSDHLFGVDLNRNNPPYWASDSSRSSDRPESLVHHGSAAGSEPEIQALRAAAELGPVDRLTMFTDVHSFSQLHLWGRSTNTRLAIQTERLLRTFSDHHAALPAGKRYAFSGRASVPRNSGIGATDELFTYEYGVPSWTLEIEPSNGASYHAPLPGAGADYGGLGRNTHDGFILPEAEIRRVREDLARTFAIAYYRQAGPPAMTALRLTDAATGAVVYEAEWDTLDAERRQLHRYQTQPLQLDRDYRAWIAWDKPMRWREGGAVVPLPGQSESTLDFQGELSVDEEFLEVALLDAAWLDEAGGTPDGYQRYRDDAVDIAFRVAGGEANRALIGDVASATLELGTTDMVGLRTDADPATVAYWFAGGWDGYEDDNGLDHTDRGGMDRTLEVEITTQALGDPFVIEPGTSAAWYDTERNGEGFMLEILAADRAVMYWFTYDVAGRQDWYVAEGAIRGNRIVFPELLHVTGGEFGPGFDPDRVVRSAVGSADFTWASCERGVMQWVIDNDGGPRRQGRMDLRRLSRVMGLPCGTGAMLPAIPAGGLSGSWYDPSHSGEGYVLEVLDDERVLVYWFSFDGAGNPRWFFGVGAIENDVLQFGEMYSTTGARFGPAFDPEQVEVFDWGSLRLELDCAGGTASFEPTETGFPAGQLDLLRLSQLAGLSCAD
jgi:hypothetical protein